MNKLLLAIFSLSLVPLLLPMSAGAQVSIPTPSFPSCLAPNGTIIASYSSGVHGIVGDSGVHTGSDAVYALGNDNVVQCFCPTGGGTGIQTNWMNAASFSADDVAAFVADGWTHVVSGIAWGLPDHPYLTKNVSFTCSAAGGGEPSIGSSGAGGGSEEQVLGASTAQKKSKAPANISKPKVAGVEIAVLPATGTQYASLVIAVLAYVITAAIAIRL